MKKNKSMKKYLLIIGVLVLGGFGYGLYSYCPWFSGLVGDKVESVAVSGLLDKAKESVGGLLNKAKESVGGFAKDLIPGDKKAE
ncbi:hypothetical protein LCGC14_1253870 [marine sediment metagenome]|uniref:Uncharacterized protein n=1 Tax=marine sediment metagenome TaxID=412755 RepID=A0A0F9L5N6_9ZZZZ